MSEARINLPAKIFPTGNFETHEDIYGKGGFVVLNDQIGASAADDFINERVTYQRRKEGMLVYISSDNSYYRCVVTGSNQSEGEWTKQYFAGRYFHGATAPTATDIQLGEKWFDTVVGTEYTYIPIADGSTHLAWVDIDHLGQSQGEVGTDFVKTSGDTMNGTLTGTNASFTGITATNGFIGTLTADRAFRISNDLFLDNELVTKDYVDNLSPSGNFVLKTGDEMSGTLTGTDASFSNSITAPNAFIGTLTGNYVKIGSDPSYILNFGSTAYQGTQNPNVPVIKSAGGVLIGGNTYTKQNWLGNNVYLAPEGHVFAGFPNNIPTSWFSADGGTYPFNLYSLNITGGIHTDRAYRWGHKKGENTFLDDEFVTRKSVMMRPVIETGSDSIVYSEFWAQNPTEDDFFDSLTKKKMGFDFPIDITFKVAATRGTSYSSRWYIKRFTNVAPVNNGTEIRIYVDRSLQLKLNGIISGGSTAGPVIRETNNGNLTNNFIMTGFLEGSQNNGSMWYFLDITPSPTGPIQY